MNAKFTGKLSAGFMVIICSLMLFPAVSTSQTAGGSIVLAKCNSWVQFNVNQYSADVVVKNIANRPNDKAMVDITIGSTKTTEQIPNGSSIAKGGFTSTKTIKIVNIEKGNSGSTCSGRGPKDGDVRVIIPGNATNITSGNIVTGSTCTVCGANFDPVRQ